MWESRSQYLCVTVNCANFEDVYDRFGFQATQHWWVYGALCVTKLAVQLLSVYAVNTLYSGRYCIAYACMIYMEVNFIVYHTNCYISMLFKDSQHAFN